LRRSFNWTVRRLFVVGTQRLETEPAGGGVGHRNRRFPNFVRRGPWPYRPPIIVRRLRLPDRNADAHLHAHRLQTGARASIPFPPPHEVVEKPFCVTAPSGDASYVRESNSMPKPTHGRSPFVLTAAIDLAGRDHAGGFQLGPLCQVG